MRPGTWRTEHRRYHEYVEQALQELGGLAAEVSRKWPADGPAFLPMTELPADLHRLCRRRDHLSDSIRLFAAIAIEAFINYYGVARLGARQFNRHVERLPLHRKVELLLLVCDQVELDDRDELLAALSAVVEGRNELAHPKAAEIPDDSELQSGDPQAAEKAVWAMRRFFARFVALVPTSHHMIPGPRVV